jgi:hypothetical protein
MFGGPLSNACFFSLSNGCVSFRVLKSWGITMSIDSYYEFADMHGCGLLSPTPFEEQMDNSMPQCFGKAEATCK